MRASSSKRGLGVEAVIGRAIVVAIAAAVALSLTPWPSSAAPARQSSIAVAASQQQASPSAGALEVGAEQVAESQISPEPAGADPTFAVFWDQGLNVQAPRRSFTLRLGGSVQGESAAFSRTGFATEFGALENGVQWRRARLFAEGVFARHFTYKFQYDFVQNNPPNLKDAYIGFKAPVAPVRVSIGRFRTPLGLEGHTTAMDTTFMERGLISAFLPSRNTGIVVFADETRQDHNFRYAVAVIKPQNNFNFTSTDLLGFSTRFSYAFVRRADIVVHVGGDYMHRPVDKTSRFLERPESNLAPQLVDTGDIPSKSIDTAIVELALLHGPWLLQAEAAATWVSRTEPAVSRLFLWGGYGFVSYMITGESRPYQTSRGNFGRVQPARPVAEFPGGRGALEAAFRVSYLDLDDDDIRGGRLLDLTWGLSWYATRNARVITNVVWVDPSLEEDNGWIAQMRLQWAY